MNKLNYACLAITLGCVLLAIGMLIHFDREDKESKEALTRIEERIETKYKEALHEVSLESARRSYEMYSRGISIEDWIKMLRMEYKERNKSQSEPLIR